MKRNEYWNTTWTDRDEAFYWSGSKFGFVTGAVLATVLIVDGIAFVKWIKGMYKTEKES